jgi:hypothetical protein
MAELPRLIVVAYAVAPGPGGPESHVNARLLQALGGWPGGVSVITAASGPALADGLGLHDRSDWSLWGLGARGEFGATSGLVRCAASWYSDNGANRQAAWLAGKVANRLAYWATGSGVRVGAWRQAARAALRRELERYPGAIVYSRALPFASLEVVAAVRRSRPFRWIANLNDPLPPGVWPGLYHSTSWTNRRMHRAFTTMVGQIDAFTFPCEQLRALETRAYPAIQRVPSIILPHVTRVVRDRAPAVDPAGPAAGRKLRIAFAGTMRATRVRPELAEALSEFVSGSPDLARHIVLAFHLARPNDRAVKYLENLPVATDVRIGESEEAVEQALQDADVLLDIESEADRPLLLTKLVNSLGFDRPVWAICAPGGTTWNLLQRGDGGYLSRLGDARAIISTLSEIGVDWSRGRLSRRRPPSALVDRFSGARQRVDLMRLCRRIVQLPRHPVDAVGEAGSDWP